MIESPNGYEFILQGTEPLVIIEYGPTGVVKGSTRTSKITLTALIFSLIT